MDLTTNVNKIKTFSNGRYRKKEANEFLVFLVETKNTENQVGEEVFKVLRESNSRIRKRISFRKPSYVVE